MIGYSDEEFEKLVQEFKTYLMLNPGDKTHTPQTILDWATSRGAVNREQIAAIIDAIRTATRYTAAELAPLNRGLFGIWASGYGTGLMTASAASTDELRFNTNDHTYSYRSEHSLSVTLPGVGGFPGPSAYASSGGSSHDRGLYIVESPLIILLVWDSGRHENALYYKDEGALSTSTGLFSRR